MKRMFKRIKQKISSKGKLPPPYRENDLNPINRERIHELRDFDDNDDGAQCEVLDLLANCKIPAGDSESSNAEYVEIEEMGVWHSTPLPGRSKLSLTWVLKENMESVKQPKASYAGDRTKRSGADVSRYQRHNQKFNENERQRKCKQKPCKERVVGRNEYYNFKVTSVCDGASGVQETCSEDNSAGTGDFRKKRRHKHRRRKKQPPHNGRFGYDIRDVDSFLSEASIDRPGNIPVVVAYPSILYQTHNGEQNEMELPLGTVVNAVFKNKQWLYVQTPHADEGYVLYTACLPLGILPNKPHSPQKKTPCWESSTDVFPRPCGNLTDNEKEQLRGRTRSECHFRTSTERRGNKYTKSLCGEKDFDSLYLKTRSASNVHDKHDGRVDRSTDADDTKKHRSDVKRHTLLLVNSDFVGSRVNNTLSVRRDDVVILIRGCGGETDVDCEWFYVRRSDGKKGFIPAEITGHGYI